MGLKLPESHFLAALIGPTIRRCRGEWETEHRAPGFREEGSAHLLVFLNLRFE